METKIEVKRNCMSSKNKFKVFQRFFVGKRHVVRGKKLVIKNCFEVLLSSFPFLDYLHKFWVQPKPNE